MKHHSITVHPLFSQRGGFSLVEMMIAIVLLGLGMVLIATMFPVAWTRARQQNEMTNVSAVVKAAEATVAAIGRVDGRDTSGSTFAGDLLHFRAGEVIYGTDTVFAIGDTRVHALPIDNLLLQPRGFVSSLPWDEQPWSLNRIDMWAPTAGINDLTDLHAGYQEFTEGQLFTSARVRFESRVHPPMRPRRDTNFTTTPDPEWDEMLDARRYAWAVLHRLRSPVTDSGQRREFDLYYVMLRRPQTMYRYAQQDPDTVPNPSAATVVAVSPRALPPENDVVLPEPWRVQVFFNEPLLVGWVPRDIPTEVQVNSPPPVVTHAMLVDFFPPGAFFIDEESGLVLRVEKRRIVGSGGEAAFLTLDRAIQQNDLLTPAQLQDIAADPTLINSFRLRTVWVFPPPVQQTQGGILTFSGGQPVVAIERRPLSISPAN